MPQYRAVPVMLSAGERRTLKKRARGAKTAYRDWLRAQIVLAAARGRASARIAADLHVSVDTVRKWRGRFAARGLDGLKDLPRSGRPRRISALERAAVVALACQLPAATGVPLSRWSGPELAAEITKAGLASPISPSSVLRILAEHPIKPWQYQSWIYPRDPDFAAKATVILDLYQGYYQGKRLRPGDRIISVDAKPSIQARAVLPRHRPARARPAGARRARIPAPAPWPCWPPWTCAPGRCSPPTPATTGIAPFMDLMGQVMSAEPYASAPRVFVIVDNGSDHRGQAAIGGCANAYPNAIMIHTPVHASWLNQVEIFFSIVQKKVISPNDFASPGDQLAATLLAFIDRYNQTARPFNWKFTATDLARLLQPDQRPPGTRQPCHRPPDDPRRTYGVTHLVTVAA